jgi:hypothetical protein
MDALIGHSGFVGSNLKLQGHFEAEFRSTDIERIEGRTFDRVICAGVTAVKWWANDNAEEDLRRIEALMRHLDRVEAKRFVLISTVDVYERPVDVDEDDPPALATLQAYGRHRALLEQYVAERFPVHHILRLPALFGRYLKKNAIYDLLKNNRLEFVSPDGRFQWYPLARLTDDIAAIQAAGLSVVNLVTEPVAMSAIQQRFFPSSKIGSSAGAGASYDIRTKHSKVFGGNGGYIMNGEAVLDALGRFLAEEAV